MITLIYRIQYKRRERKKKREKRRRKTAEEERREQEQKNKISMLDTVSEKLSANGMP